MKLSDQAMAAIMGALQKCILEQSDIVPILKDFEFDKSPDAKRWAAWVNWLLRTHRSSLCKWTPPM